MNGFGRKEFIILLAVMLIAIIISMSLFNQKVTPEEEVIEEPVEEKVTYTDLEKKLKLGAERYQNDNYSVDADKDETWILTYTFLKKEDYLDKIKDLSNNEECDGYVIFEKEGMNITYAPYLKCSNYTTKGFDSKNLEDTENNIESNIE